MSARSNAVERIAESAVATVTAAEIAAYRDAVRADSPASERSGPVSPVFPFVLAAGPADAVVARLRETLTEPTAVVHIGQEIQISRLPLPGQQLSVHSELFACRQESRGARLALRSVLTDDDDRPVAELRSAVLLSGATSAGTFGEQPPSTAPQFTPNGDSIQVTRQLTAEFIARYADASGDHNPIHLDPVAAAAAGFPGVIAHGMSVVALVCEEIADRCLDGDIGRIHALGVRFSSPVQPGEPLDIRLQPAAGAVGFSARTPHGPALKSGWVGIDE